MKHEKSCGAVVYRFTDGNLFFLIEHMKLGHVSIPKGHVEGNETEEETAVREIREETNLEVRLDTGFRHEVSYSPSPGIEKQVVFFAAEAATDDLKNQECEVSALEWMPWEQAIGAVTYGTDKEVLSHAAAYLGADGAKEAEAKQDKERLTLVDRAIIFATQRHSGTFRKSTTIPYITHVIEAMEIVSRMTDDEEVRAAAVLHDTIEDTGATREELAERFGSRVAELVAAESENKREDLPEEVTWIVRKQETVRHLAKAGTDVRMITLGDKLSNIRAIYKDPPAGPGPARMVLRLPRGDSQAG